MQERVYKLKSSERTEKEFIREGLTFDDVLLVPKRSPVSSRKEINTSSFLTKQIPLHVPIMSANMDTVTESAMAIAMAREGGIGMIHRFMPVRQQVEEVLKVKRSEGVVIEKPYTMTPNRTLEEAKKLMANENVTGIVVIDEHYKAVGMLTARDILFEENPLTPIGLLMTKDIITAQTGVSLDEARALLHENRIEKLPLVDSNGVLKGMVTSKDIVKRTEHPFATKDKKGRLMVGAAIGVKEGFLQQAELLLQAEVDVLVVDIAHGHSDIAIRTVKKLKENFGDQAQIIAGNVATAEATADLISAGADAVKVGVGPGSTCITRIVTGSGVPQLTAVMDCASIAKEQGVPVIADGGIKNSGDLTKALAAGASTAMLGNLLAGTEESPGKIIMREGRRFKIFRGMASLGANWGRQEKEGDKEAVLTVFDIVPEGVEALVPYRGTVREVINSLVGGLKSGISYCGSRSIPEMQMKAEFMKMSPAGLRESGAHDVVK